MSWLDPGRCSSCKHCSMDMDMAPFCSYPEVLKIHPWGVNLNKAISAFCGEDLKLREPMDPQRSCGADSCREGLGEPVIEEEKPKEEKPCG
jgi:predicted metal-binding protein